MVNKNKAFEKSDLQCGTKSLATHKKQYSRIEQKVELYRDTQSASKYWTVYHILLSLYPFSLENSLLSIALLLLRELLSQKGTNAFVHSGDTCLMQICHW